ncbi:MAG: small ribosomal subunit Rsm22 family protein [Myxococcales bacterium]
MGSLTRTGRKLALGPSAGGALSDAVAELSRVYTRERDALAERSRGQTVLGARLAFFLPRDLVKVLGPLSEIKDWLVAHPERSLRVLDVGAGLGATSLGLSRFLRLAGARVERLEVTALERDARALSVFEHLCGELVAMPDEFVPIQLDARTQDVSDARLGSEFDLVLFGFVLNELYTDLPVEQRITRRTQLLEQAASRLRPGGAVIVLEPALKESTRELMRVRDELAASPKAPFVFAPCTRLGPCPMLAGERDWCHQELPYVLPPALAQVAQGAGLRFEGLSYASLVLRNEPRVFTPAPGAEGDALYRIVSERLESKGKLELYGCGEAGYVRFTRLERDDSEENRAFGEARRGDLLRIAEPLDPPGRLGKQTRAKRQS